MEGSSLGAAPTVQSAAKAGETRRKRTTESRRIAGRLRRDHGHIVARAAVALPVLAIRPADSTHSANPVSTAFALTASGWGTKAGFMALKSKADTNAPG